MIAFEIEEFGRLLGVEGLKWPLDGVLHLDIEPRDTLCLQSAPGGLVFSLARSQTYPGIPSAARLLELTHFSNASSPPTHVRRRDFGRTNVFYTVFPEETLRATALLAALDEMTKLHNLAESV